MQQFAQCSVAPCIQGRRINISHGRFVMDHVFRDTMTRRYSLAEKRAYW